MLSFHETLLAVKEEQGNACLLLLFAHAAATWASWRQAQAAMLAETSSELLSVRKGRAKSKKASSASSFAAVELNK